MCLMRVSVIGLAFVMMAVLRHARSGEAWRPTDPKDAETVMPFYIPQHQSLFYDMAARHGTDKVTQHHYEHLYTKYLEQRRVQPLKVLEVGLGCDMVYGPGRSAALWHDYLPNAQLWFAEVDADCVAKHAERLAAMNIRVVTGDQRSVTDLQRWVRETGGEFDVIIDDGGHTSMAQYNTFLMLFQDALKPGGIYFMEDLHVSRWGMFADGGRHRVMIEVIKDWLEGLVLSAAQDDGHKVLLEHYKKAGAVPYLPSHALPAGIKELDCQDQMCAFIKCLEEDSHCPRGLPQGPYKSAWSYPWRWRP